MNPMQRFSVLEVCDVTGIKLTTLKSRFFRMKRAGDLPKTAVTTALTYEEVKAILRMPTRPHGPKMANRPQARALLRQQLTNDGML